MGNHKLRSIFYHCLLIHVAVYHFLLTVACLAIRYLLPALLFGALFAVVRYLSPENNHSLDRLWTYADLLCQHLVSTKHNVIDVK